MNKKISNPPMLTFFVILMICSCTIDRENSNPVGSEPGSSNMTIVSGPEENAVVQTGEIEFSWSSGTEGYEYSYRIDEAEWSEWTSDTLFSDLLDDGDHVFSVKCRLIPGIGE